MSRKKPAVPQVVTVTLTCEIILPAGEFIRTEALADAQYIEMAKRFTLFTRGIDDVDARFSKAKVDIASTTRAARRVTPPSTPEERYTAFVRNAEETHHACPEGREFLREHKTFESAWYNLVEPGWFIWINEEYPGVQAHLMSWSAQCNACMVVARHYEADWVERIGRRLYDHCVEGQWRDRDNTCDYPVTTGDHGFDGKFAAFTRGDLQGVLDSGSSCEMDAEYMRVALTAYNSDDLEKIIMEQVLREASEWE